MSLDRCGCQIFCKNLCLLYFRCDNGEGGALGAAACLRHWRASYFHSPVQIVVLGIHNRIVIFTLGFSEVIWSAHAEPKQRIKKIGQIALTMALTWYQFWFFPMLPPSLIL